MWRMRRIPLFEAALIELGHEEIASNKRLASILQMPLPFKEEERKEAPYENTARAFRNSQQTFGSLFRYEAALMNNFNRTLQQLLFLQDRRARDEDESHVVDPALSIKLIGVAPQQLGSFRNFAEAPQSY